MDKTRLDVLRAINELPAITPYGIETALDVPKGRLMEELRNLIEGGLVCIQGREGYVMENLNSFEGASQEDGEGLADILRFLMAGKRANKVADGAGVSQQLISKILRGKSKRPAYDSLQKLASYFGLTIPQLLGTAPLLRDYDSWELQLTDLGRGVYNYVLQE